MTNSPHQPAAESPIRTAAMKVIEVLQGAGHCAYFAGGCVRDALLGIEPKDYDIATDAHPTQVRALFHRTIPVGEHFGVILVQLKAQRIEVATFRAEGPYSDHRRPDAVHFTDARADAERRDFTINGMFEDPIAQQVIDYVGGQEDLQAKQIRAIGNADHRLAEDHLRALRAVRFSARFGFAIEETTAAAIRRHAAELVGVSRERVGHELRAMFKEPSAAQAIEQLHNLNLDAPTLLRRTDEKPLNDQSSWPILSVLETPAPFETILIAWALECGETFADDRFIARWRKALVLTNDECAAMRSILVGLSAMHSGWAKLSVARRKRLAVATQFKESMRIMGALNSHLAAQTAENVKALSQTATGLQPDQLVNGDDLRDLGLVPGPKFREILDTLYDRQLEGSLLTKADALNDLMQLTAGDESR